jgi:hypothetical protein
MEHHNNTASGVAWLALVVAILALILAWSAYNRAGQDLAVEVADELDQAAEEVEDAAVNVEREFDEEFVDEDEFGDRVETDTSVNVVED